MFVSLWITDIPVYGEGSGDDYEVYRVRQCHENANCSNIPGSYICECINGHLGDGFLCKGTHLTWYETELSFPSSQYDWTDILVVIYEGKNTGSIEAIPQVDTHRMGSRYWVRVWWSGFRCNNSRSLPFHIGFTKDRVATILPEVPAFSLII